MRTPLIIVLLSLLSLMGCGSDNSVAVSVIEKPSSPKLTFLFTSETTSFSVSWLPSSDNKSSTDEITYQVHVSTSNNFTPEAATLKAEVLGITTALVEGLTAATQYYVVVQAVDLDGNVSDVVAYGEVTTATHAMAFSATQLTQTAEELNLPEPVISPDGITYTFARHGAPPGYLT